MKLGSGGVLPVAILTTDDFDVSAVDPSTVTLGDDDGDDTPVKTKGKGSKLFASTEDVDDDGDLDLTLKFDKRELQDNGDLDGSTTELVLNGETKDGTSIKGSDSIRLTP